MKVFLGGTPLFIETLGCAGIAANVDGIFLETHPNPKKLYLMEIPC